MDFMSDSLIGIRKFITFNVMDDCYRVNSKQSEQTKSQSLLPRILNCGAKNRGLKPIHPTW